MEAPEAGVTEADPEEEEVVTEVVTTETTVKAANRAPEVQLVAAIGEVEAGLVVEETDHTDEGEAAIVEAAAGSIAAEVVEAEEAITIITKKIE